MFQQPNGGAAATGVIGLGVMGHPMAANILRNGTAVQITGRSPQKYGDLIEAGAVWHDTPQSLADAVAVIVLMLPDLPQVEEMLSGPHGILAGDFEDLLLIIASTSSPIDEARDTLGQGAPIEVRDLGRRLTRETQGRVRVIDAPVSGGSEGAKAGTLSIMVGGDERDVNDAWPVLAACGSPVHLGPLGSGQVAKACNQMIVAATVLAIGEAAVLADRSGLDLDKLFRLLAGGYADSRILKTRGDRIVREDYTPSGAARYLVKDLRFAATVAQATGTNAILLPVLQAAFTELTERGYGDHDIAVTRRYVAQR